MISEEESIVKGFAKEFIKDGMCTFCFRAVEYLPYWIEHRKYRLCQLCSEAILRDTKDDAELRKRIVDHFRHGGYEKKLVERKGKEEVKMAEGYADDEENEKKDKKEVVKYISFLETDTHLYEQVYDAGENLYAVYDVSADSVSYAESVKVDGITYKPIEAEEITKEAIRLPTHAEEYINDDELDKEISGFTTKWADVSEEFRQYGIWCIKKSWVYDRFHTTNYLCFRGDLGSGKTRCKDVFGSLHYKPINCSGATSVAALKRIIEKWKGTMLIDEADIKYSDATNDFIKIINLGFEKRQQLISCNPNDPTKLDFFDPYSPKVICTRKPFEDKATESRCMIEVVSGTNRAEIPVELNKSFFADSKKLRNKLLMWRFRNYHKIDPDAAEHIDLGDIDPRLRQINAGFLPLFASDSAKVEQFKKYLKKKQEELIEDRRNSMEGRVVEAISSLLRKGIKNIDAGDIVDVAGFVGRDGKKFNPRGISSTLKILGFAPAKPEKVLGKTKRCIPIDEKHIEHLCKRYGVTEVTADTEEIDSERTNVDDGINNYSNNSNNSNDSNLNTIFDQKEEEFMN